MPSQWEYKLEELSPAEEAKLLAEHLNGESADGWDLVTVLPASDDTRAQTTVRLVFRRELANPTWSQ